MAVGAKLGDLAEGLKGGDGRKTGGKGAWIPRVWTKAGKDPMDEVAYEKRTDHGYTQCGRFP